MKLTLEEIKLISSILSSLHGAGSSLAQGSTAKDLRVRMDNYLTNGPAPQANIQEYDMHPDLAPFIKGLQSLMDKHEIALIAKASDCGRYGQIGFQKYGKDNFNVYTRRCHATAYELGYLAVNHWYEDASIYPCVVQHDGTKTIHLAVAWFDGSLNLEGLGLKNAKHYSLLTTVKDLEPQPKHVNIKD